MSQSDSDDEQIKLDQTQIVDEKILDVSELNQRINDQTQNNLQSEQQSQEDQINLHQGQTAQYYDQFQNVDQDIIQDEEEFQHEKDDSMKDLSDKQEKDIQQEVQPQKVQNKKNREKPLKIRSDQYELFKNSLDINSIIFLPTGSGKTLVSMMAMQYYLCKYGQEKKILFLANTIQLVKQQAESMRRYLPIICQHNQIQQVITSRLRQRYYGFKITKQNAKQKIICLHGQKNQLLGNTKRKTIENNVKDRKQLINKMKKGTIIVMIAQMFINCLRRGYIKLTDFSFIVFDECHHCKGQHPFSNIMTQFYFEEKLKLQNFNKPNSNRPKDQIDHHPQKLPVIMGLTASPVQQIHNRIENIRQDIKRLAINLDSDYVYYNIRTQNDIEDQVQRINIILVQTESEQTEFIPDLIKYYESIEGKQDPLTQSLKKLQTYLPQLAQMIQKIQQITKDKQMGKSFSQLIQQLLQCLLLKSVAIWLQLGKYAFFMVLDDILKQFIKIEATKQQQKILKKQIDSIFTYYFGKFKSMYGTCSKQFFSPKLIKLIQIITDQQKENQKRILIFVSQRIVVKYLQKVFSQYVLTLSDFQDKTKLISKGVTGYSKKTYHSNDSINQQFTQNPTDFQRQQQIARQRQEQQQRQDIENLANFEGANRGLQRQQMRMQSSKIARTLLENQEKYSAQIETIKQFRGKIFPILITTSVTQQGFDIPDCNLVISFNIPTQLKSFIQIKGRARQKNSKYIILTYETEKNKMTANKTKYIQTIKLAQKIAIQELAIRAQNKGIRKPSYRRPDGYKVTRVKSGAIINTNYSIQLLKAYLNTIKPSQLKTVPKLFEYYFNVPQTGYICWLIMKGCPVSLIESQICRTKKDSLRNAAYRAVVQLRKKSHLKQDLKPKNEAQLYDESQLQKYNDLQLIKVDAAYQQIFKNNVQVQIDQKNNRRQKLHFKYLKNDRFDFQQINPQFKQNLNAWKINPFKFQLYVIKITNNQKTVQFENINTNSDVHIGILTGFRSQHTNQIFSNFRYEISKKLNQYYSLELVDANYEINLTKYNELKKIHTFLVTSIINQEVFYLRQLTSVQPSVISWKTKLKNCTYAIDQQRKYHPLFIILNKSNNKQLKYQVSQDLNKKILNHIDNMAEIYKYHNTNKNKNKNQKFPVDLSQQLLQFSKLEHRQHISGNYLVQSITNDFLLHKCVITQQQKLEVSNLKQMFVKGQGKTGDLNFQKKYNQLKSIYPHANSSNDKIIKIQLSRKILRNKIYSYLKNEGLAKKTEEHTRNSKFLSQFIKYPLDLQTLFVLQMAKQYVLPKIQDYIRAYYFKYTYLQKLYKAGLNKKLSQPKKYKFTIKNNPIIAHSQQIIDTLSGQNNPHLRQISKKLKYGYKNKYKFPIQAPEKYIKERGLSNYTVKNKENIRPQQFYQRLNINQILKCLTSRLYKSNKRENYEEYQFIGDVVLKLLATIQIFVEKDIQQEGQMHLARANVISNANLHRKSIRKQLFQFILTKPLVQYPAPLKILYDQSTVKEDYYKQTNIKMKNSASEFEGYRYVPGKIHADVIQAMVGMHFLHRKSLQQCKFFLYSMGILKFEGLDIDYSYESNIKNKQLAFFEQIQNRLNHKFKNKGILLQAFTHKNFQNILQKAIDKQLTNLKKKIQNLEQFKQIYQQKIYMSKLKNYQLYYERLEFLGDSVLDLIAVEYIFEKQNKEIDQGTFSILKQASVSNRTLGLVALYWGLDQFILIDNKQTVNLFQRIRKNFEYYYTNPDQIFTTELAPLKILGDVFQACIGAIFIDCKLNYDYIRFICRRLMQPFIDHFTEPNMMKNYPQYKYAQFLKINNFEGIKIVKNFEAPPIDGKYQYILMDRSNKEINRCRQQTEKKAWDQLIEIYVKSMKNGP